MLRIESNVLKINWEDYRKPSEAFENRHFTSTAPKRCPVSLKMFVYQKLFTVCIKFFCGIDILFWHLQNTDQSNKIMKKNIDQNKRNVVFIKKLKWNQNVIDEF